ncbi:MAG: (2Fe-2S)-binding protein [Xanthomonadales bacterium]|nr:(2Fe-2S)-binding protein [Xanthomonadales bacterium]
MYVCSCKSVTDTDIRNAVNSGVRTMRQLARETGCSSNCGRCAVTAAEVLDEATGKLSIVRQARHPDQA